MTHTLREKALSPEEAEFERLVERGMAEAKFTEEWLSGTASIKLTPFALRGLAHSFGLHRDEIDRLRHALKPFAGDKLPSLKPSVIDFDRNGLRRIMSPMEIATRNASQALRSTP